MTSVVINLLLSTGLFTGSVAWQVNDLGLDALGGKIHFQSKACEKYDFIQAAQVLDNNDNPYKWKMGESNRNKVTTSGGWFIDHLAGKCNKGQPCSPIYTAYWPTEGAQGTKMRPSALEDYPFGWTEFKRIYLETCAVCENNKNILGCVVWGGEFPIVGSKNVLEPTANENSSENFNQALNKFNKFYKNK